MKMFKYLTLVIGLCIFLIACVKQVDGPEKLANTSWTAIVVTEISSTTATGVTPEEVSNAPIGTPSNTPTTISTHTRTATPTPVSVPTPSTTPQPEILHSDNVRLIADYVDPTRSRLDLDTGQVLGPDNQEADIELLMTAGSMVFLNINTVNGARAQIYRSGVHSFDACFERREELIQNLIPDYEYGTICVLTNEGRLSLLRFRRANYIPNEDWVEFWFATWTETVASSPSH